MLLLRADLEDLARLGEGEVVEAADAATYGLERAWTNAAPLLAARGEQSLAAELEKGIEQLHEAVHTGDRAGILAAREALLPLLARAAEVLEGGYLARLRDRLGLLFWQVLTLAYATGATVAALLFYRRSRRLRGEDGLRSKSWQ